MVKKQSTMTITVGIQGSGKSTWAKREAKVRANTVRVNRDDLRAMLGFASRSDHESEAYVSKLHDGIIEETLRRGKNIIVDNMNLRMRYLRELVTIGKRHNAIIVFQDFTDVPLATCIARDALRSEKVIGAEEITRTYNTYVKNYHRDYDALLRMDVSDPNEELKLQLADPSLPPAIIIDVDGTVAINTGRSPFEWDRVGEDTPNANVIDLIVRMALADSYSDLTFIFLSGRDEVCYDATRTWLANNVVEPDLLYMRPRGDMRKDALVKKELVVEHIAGRFRVLAAIDDRKQVIDMWRNELGITVLDVAGNTF